jgi:hypothetical protein
MAVVFLTTVTLNFSRRFQAWALKEGRSISEVRAEVMLVLAVSAMMLIAMTFWHLGS